VRLPEEEHRIALGEKSVAVTDEPSGATIVTERIPQARELFSAREVLDYDVQATDGEVGDVDDFLVDDSTWDIRYLVADSSKWLSGRKVLLSSDWIDSIDEDESEVRADLSRDAIGKSPAYDEHRPVDASYENALFEHYGREAEHAPYALWRFNYMRHAMGTGRKLRIVVSAPAVVRWSGDNWRSVRETKTHDTGTGIHIADLDTAGVPAGNSVHFTFFWPLAGHWEGKNFSVKVKQPGRVRERTPEPAGV
jgi:hypothetical protein